MSGHFRAFSALWRAEWTRRRPFLVGAALSALALWGAALALFPSTRDGSMSFEVIVLSTMLFGSLVAADAFASDARSGALEFLFANGARPATLFLSRAAVILSITGSYLLIVYGAEAFRLVFLGPPRPSARWTGHGLTWIAKNPREALLLFVLPALALFLFVSAVSNRSRTAFGLGVGAIGVVLALDRLASGSSLEPLRPAAASAISTAVCLPAIVVLAAIAIRVRRIEPERSGPRVVLLGAAGVALALRFLATTLAALPPPASAAVASALAVSPDGRRVAIETKETWTPSDTVRWASGALGRPVPAEGGAGVVRVAVAGLDGKVSSVSELPARLETRSDVPAWISGRHLRVEGADPASPDAVAMSPRSLVFDADRKRIAEGPAVFPADVEGAARQRRWSLTLPIDAAPDDSGAQEKRDPRFLAAPWSGGSVLRDEDGDGTIEVTELAEDRRLRVTSEGAVHLDGPANVRRQIWPPPGR